MREKLATLMFVVVLAFIAVFTFTVFDKLFIDIDRNFANSAYAAFFGAFLAFLFVRIGDFFKAYSDRASKNHSALVKLEHALNALLTILDDNVYVIDTFEKLYDAHFSKQEERRLFVWANRLHPVPQLDALLLELINIDLINELFGLNVRLRKLNQSMETINSAYSENKGALIGGNMDPDNYEENLKRIHRDLLEIRKFLNSHIEETTESLAAVRILAKKRPLMSHVLSRLVGRKYGRNFDDLRVKELAKLKEETEELKERSDERIETVTGKNGKDS